MAYNLPIPRVLSPLKLRLKALWFHLTWKQCPISPALFAMDLRLQAIKNNNFMLIRRCIYQLWSPLRPSLIFSFFLSPSPLPAQPSNSLESIPNAPLRRRFSQYSSVFFNIWNLRPHISEMLDPISIFAFCLFSIHSSAYSSKLLLLLHLFRLIQQFLTVIKNLSLIHISEPTRPY